jgi:RNase P/RNase MRP subunit POP5
MVVKCKRGRIRYIAFGMSEGMKKDVLIKGVRAVGPSDPPYIIQCSCGKAIVPCAPKNIEETLRIISQVDPSCAPLMTSGTIRKIRDRYPELKTTKNKPS